MIDYDDLRKKTEAVKRIIAESYAPKMEWKDYDCCVPDITGDQIAAYIKMLFPDFTLRLLDIIEAAKNGLYNAAHSNDAYQIIYEVIDEIAKLENE